MGRGEGNLLFDENILKKGRGRNLPHRLRGGTFPAGARNLLLTRDFALLRDKRNTLHPLERDLSEGEDLGLPPKIEEEANIALGGGRFVWGDKDGFVIQDLTGKRGAFYKEDLPGSLSGISVDEETLFAASTSRDNSTQLYKTNSTDESDWEELSEYSYGKASLLQKGDRPFVFYEETGETPPAFVTLSPSGPEKTIFLPRGFNNYSDPKNLMAAIDSNHCLAVVENEEGEAELRHLSIESFAASGAASNQFVASLTEKNDISSMFFKNIAASEGRVLVLGSRELILADNKGIIEVIPLSEKERGQYDRLSFTGERAVLWQDKYDAYQEFFLPKE